MRFQLGKDTYDAKPLRIYWPSSSDQGSRAEVLRQVLRRTRYEDEGLWSPRRSIEQLWRLRYEELVNYKEIHGDCKVPKVYEQNPPLGF
jgi:hypothetical protein